METSTLEVDVFHCHERELVVSEAQQFQSAVATSSAQCIVLYARQRLLPSCPLASIDKVSTLTLETVVRGH